jgi:hypothetical protein
VIRCGGEPETAEHRGQRISERRDTAALLDRVGRLTPHRITSDTPQRRGNNRDVSAERCWNAASVPETSGSYSRSDPREDVRTPAGSNIAFPRIVITPETVDAPQ